METKKISRYVIYLFSLFIISLGGAISIKANLGTSPIICLPYVSSIIMKMSVGTVCLIFNVFFIAVQVILLRGDFERRQYLQIIIGTIFSLSIDFSMMLVSFLNPSTYIEQFGLLLLSCLVVAFGVLLEVQTEVVYLPPDGTIVAISKVLKKEFPNVKPFFDTGMVIIAAILSIVFLGTLAGVREGTIISALIIGPIVKLLQGFFNPYIEAIIEK